MILIISDQHDKTTNNVIYWLLYFKINFYRINDTTKIEISKFSFGLNFVDIKILLTNESSNENEEINYNDIKCVWYRRGFFNLDLSSFLVDQPPKYWTDY